MSRQTPPYNMRSYSFAPGEDQIHLHSHQNEEHTHEPPPSYDMSDSYRSASTSSRSSSSSRSDSITSTNSRPRGPRLSVSKIPPAEYVMRDEERYPIPVVEDPGLHYVSPVTPTPQSAISQHVVSPLTIVATNQGDRHMQDPIPVTNEKEKTNIWKKSRCCGLRRRTFIAIVIAFALLVIGGTVAGIIVAIKFKATSTARLPGLTSSGLFLDANRTVWNSQIAYTNTTSGKVNFRLNNGSDTYRAPQVMNLTILPDTNAPLSMVSMTGIQGAIIINLFYIHDSQIVLANVSCSLNDCDTTYNGVISDDLVYPVSDNSGIAAIYLGADAGIRLFYHSTDNYLTQLSMSASGRWDHGTVVAGKAYKGSSISTAKIGSGSMFAVFYVEAKTEVLYYTQHNNTWQAATSLSETALSDWSPLTAFSTCWEPTADIAYAFFTGTDKRVYELSSPNATKVEPGPLNWGTQTHDLSWVDSDKMKAAIGSIAWDDQARFYRLVEDELAQSQFSAGVWSAKFI